MYVYSINYVDMNMEDLKGYFNMKLDILHWQIG